MNQKIEICYAKEEDVPDIMATSLKHQSVFFTSVKGSVVLRVFIISCTTDAEVLEASV